MKLKLFTLTLYLILLSEKSYSQTLKLINEAPLSYGNMELYNTLHTLNTNDFVISYLKKKAINSTYGYYLVSKNNNIISLPQNERTMGRNNTSGSKRYFIENEYLYELYFDEAAKLHINKVNIADSSKKVIHLISNNNINDQVKGQIKKLDAFEWINISSMNIENNVAYIITDCHFNETSYQIQITINLDELILSSFLFNDDTYPQSDYKSYEQSHPTIVREGGPDVMQPVNGSFYSIERSSKELSRVSVSRNDWFITKHNTKGEKVDSFIIPVNPKGFSTIVRFDADLHVFDPLSYIFFDGKNQYIYTANYCEALSKENSLYIQKLSMDGKLIWQKNINLKILTPVMNTTLIRQINLDTDQTLFIEAETKNDHIFSRIDLKTGELIRYSNTKNENGYVFPEIEPLLNDLLAKNKELSYLRKNKPESSIIMVGDKDYFVVLMGKKSFSIYRYN